MFCCALTHISNIELVCVMCCDKQRCKTHDHIPVGSTCKLVLFFLMFCLLCVYYFFLCSNYLLLLSDSLFYVLKSVPQL